MWEEENKVGIRELARQRCLDMDWKNPKEITAWEVALCIHKYNDITLDRQELSEDRQASIQKHIDQIDNDRHRDILEKKINYVKKLINDKYPSLDLSSCKNKKQLASVIQLIDNSSLKKLASFVDNDFRPRDPQHYSEDFKSYLDHLQYAWGIHKKYNYDLKDKEAIEIVDDMFKRLIDLGLPRPYTKKEVKIEYFEDFCFEELQKAGFKSTPAEKLSKQITKIHFPR